ncbi:21393_t:CDS:2, partial [Cetraspora pellucida]
MGLLMSTSLFNVETDINIVPVSLDGKGNSVKCARVNKVEVHLFQHDEVNANFLVKSSDEFVASNGSEIGIGLEELKLRTLMLATRI